MTLSLLSTVSIANAMEEKEEGITSPASPSAVTPSTNKSATPELVTPIVHRPTPYVPLPNRSKGESGLRKSSMPEAHRKLKDDYNMAKPTLNPFQE